MKSIIKAGLLAIVASGFAMAQEPLYTLEQAEAGQRVYERSCAMCHGGELQGASHAPQLAGPDFQNTWSNRTVAELHDYTSSTMPLGNPGGLTSQQYLDVTAYILRANGHPAGTETYSGAELQNVSLLATPEGAEDVVREDAPAAPVAEPIIADEVGTTTTRRAVENWETVTDERVLNPEPGDWASFRRTVESLSDSPLDQVNTSNVHNLRHEWAWSSDDNFNFEVTPVVANGVMFVAEHRDGSGRVVALDASNGDVLWSYERVYPDGVVSRYVRGVTVAGDVVYWSSADAVLVALDASTGEEVWESAAVDYRDPLAGSYSAPPLVIDGVAVVGNTQGDAGARGRLDAFDITNGELLWSAYTTPEQGAPGSETWGNVVPAGATPWLTPSYDAELGLVYVGTGQPFPWTPIARGGGAGGSADDALWSNHILAYDLHTGELAWAKGIMPGEYWDFDTAHELALFDVELDGETRQVLVQHGKAGIGVMLDRATGELLNWYEFATTNIVDHYDEDGNVVYAADQVPSVEDMENGTTFFTCPFVNGARATGAAAYSERTGHFYVGVVENCMDISYTTTGIGASFTMTMAPDKDYMGAVAAIDPLTGEKAWEWVSESGASVVGGTMSTAGGLVFVGTTDRWFFALDEQTGEQLWSTRLNGDVGTPITYEVDGRQYVSVVGGANFWGTQFANPLMGLPVEAATGVVWSFALPEAN